jgi:hypothetical protein
MMYDQGCPLNEEGAQRAASSKLKICSRWSFRSEKAMGLHRSRINSCTGAWVSAGFRIGKSPSSLTNRSAADLRVAAVLLQVGIVASRPGCKPGPSPLAIGPRST